MPLKRQNGGKMGNVNEYGRETEFTVSFDSVNKKFDTNQQIVYEFFRNAGIKKLAIAGIMGNIHVESRFDPTWKDGEKISCGLCHWYDRKNKLAQYAQATGRDKSDINMQLDFILEEADKNSIYKDTSGAIECFEAFRKQYEVGTVRKAADYFAALFERCKSFATREEALQNTEYDPNRFTVQNERDNKYYIDNDYRRGYAEAYYQCMLKMI